MNTTRPDLPDCFQQTVLVWAPAAFLWVCLPIYAFLLSRTPTLYSLRYKTPLNTFKIVSTALHVRRVYSKLTQSNQNVSNIKSELTQETTVWTKSWATAVVPKLFLTLFWGKKSAKFLDIWFAGKCVTMVTRCFTFSYCRCCWCCCLWFSWCTMLGTRMSMCPCISTSNLPSTSPHS